MKNLKENTKFLEIEILVKEFFNLLMLQIFNKVTKNIDTKNGKLPTSHRYNRLPLLRSHSGGFTGAGCVGLAGANIEIIYEFKRIMLVKLEEKSLLMANSLIFK